MNVCFEVLDRPVVAGRGDEAIFDDWTFARLLEGAAAMGGVFMHLGVGPGDVVRVAECPDADAIVAALAAARIGAVVTQGVGRVVVGTGGSGTCRLMRDGHDPDLDWAVMLRAGRTDPASARSVGASASYSDDRSVGEQVRLLAGLRLPTTARELRAALQAQ